MSFLAGGTLCVLRLIATSNYCHGKCTQIIIEMFFKAVVDLELSTYMDPLALPAEIDFRLGSVTLDP